MWARGVEQRQIFADDLDREHYLWRLGRVVGHKGWNCLAYCLMGNHVHLLLETPAPNLGRGMSVLHGGYARHFNERHGRVGHLFERRYGATPITTDAYLWTVVTYIARNPVAAGLVATADEYRWSSHRSVAAGGAPTWLAVDRLLGLFSGAGGDPRLRYLGAVAA